MHVGSIQFRLLGVLAIGCISAFIACSGGGSSASSAQQTVSTLSILMSPDTLTINTGAQTQFTVTEQGSSASPSNVSWTADRGTITPSGVYTAPESGGDDTVTAAVPGSGASTSMVRARIKVVKPNAVDAVTVSPATLTMNTGSQSQFTASVTGSGTFDTSVTWSARLGSITSTGLYTAPASGGTDTITATSTFTPTKSGTAKVTVVLQAPPTVTVSPASLTVNTASQTQFSATVLNGSGTIDWSAKLGTITSAGLYTAPTAAGTDVVTASLAGTGVVATSTVQITVPTAVTSVTVSPLALSVETGSQTQFAATVSGTGKFDSSVTWTAKLGTITSAGLYTAPAVAGKDTITVTSVATPADTASATVTVTAPAPAPTVTVAPASLSVNVSSQAQFSATVSGGSGTITWSAKLGSISTTGLYTAPASAGNDTVTATLAGTSASSSAAITVVVPTIVSSTSVSPVSITVNTGSSTQFSASVTGSGGYSSAVTWSAKSGTITSSGRYTAPASACSDTVTVTSVQDPASKATASITVVPTPAVTSVAVTPGSASSSTGAKTQFSATVVGVGSYSSVVTWSAKLGTITSSGLYTAPASAGTDTVTATSVQTSTVSGTGTVTVKVPASVTSVSISPETLSLTVGAKNQFSAAVAGTGDYSAGVTWKAEKGTITVAGLYTAPAAACTDTVTASSTQDGTKLDQTAVNVLAAQDQAPPAAPVVSCPLEVQQGGGPYKATVVVPSGATVQWNIPKGGTITGGATSATVTFTAGIDYELDLSCVLTNSAGNSPAGKNWITVLPFAPRDYLADTKDALSDNAGAIATQIQSGDSDTYYTTSYFLHALAGAAEATGDTTLMDALVGDCIQMIGYAKTKTRNGIDYPEWGPLDVNGNPGQLGTFQASGALARTAAIIAGNPAFATRYAKQFTTIVDFVDKSIFGYWFDKKTGVYADPGSQWLGGDVPWLPTSLGGWGSYPIWNDKCAHFGMMATWLYQATGKDLYKEYATRVAKGFLTHVTLSKGYMLWDVGLVTNSVDDYNTDGCLDTSHANREPMMVAAMYQAGIVFQQADIQALAATFSDLIWNQDKVSPQFNNYIDGGNTAYGPHGPYSNGYIYFGWNMMGRYSAKAQFALAVAHRLLETQSSGALSDSLSSNATPMGLLGMAGGQAWNLQR